MEGTKGKGGDKLKKSSPYDKVIESRYFVCIDTAYIGGEQGEIESNLFNLKIIEKYFIHISLTSTESILGKTLHHRSVEMDFQIDK